MSDTRPNQQIFEEAATWFVAFRDQGPDSKAREDFHAWLKRSPDHIRAYLEIASVYADIPAPELGRTPPELIAKAKMSPDINVVTLPGAALPVEQTSPKARRHAWQAIAAVFVLTLVSLSAWLFVERNTYGTAVGEQRAITLPDGSIVELNARSKVRVAFHDRQRDIELVEGQALFRVAKDHNRPFVVHVGSTMVRAVGTQFDVYRRTAGTTVTVLEGTVAVRGSSSGAALLVAGEQAVVTPTQTNKAKPANVSSAVAWTQHQLVFDGTPLSEVVEEFRRYSKQELIIDTPELADLRISGQYTSSSPESLLRFLSLQEGVVVTEMNGETHIRKQ